MPYDDILLIVIGIDIEFLQHRADGITNVSKISIFFQRLIVIEIVTVVNVWAIGRQIVHILIVDYAAIVGNTIGEHGDFLAVYLAADGKADDVLTYL